MASRKRQAPVDIPKDSLGDCSEQPKLKKKAKQAKPLDPKKFGGMTEEEVCKLLLPDHMKPDMDIIFVSMVTFLWYLVSVSFLIPCV